MNDFQDMDELGRLFLGDVRDRQTEGKPLPMRRRPSHPKPGVSIDLTPEEFARMYGQGDESPAAPQQASGSPAPQQAAHRNQTGTLEAAVMFHLNGHRREYVRRYARSLAAGIHGDEKANARIGLIELDETGLHVRCFERMGDPVEGEPLSMTEARPIVDALQEMSWDVGRWVLSVGQMRDSRTQSLLHRIHAWTLLATSDHDGVVGAYRTMKTLHRPEARTVVAVLDALDDHQAMAVFTKLNHVCTQFLNWPMQGHLFVPPELQVTEHLVLSCNGIDPAAAWQAVEQFVSDFGHAEDSHTGAVSGAAPEAAQAWMGPAISKQTVGDFVVPVTLTTLTAAPAASSEPAHAAVDRKRPADAECMSSGKANPLDAPPATPGPRMQGKDVQPSRPSMRISPSHSESPGVSPSFDELRVIDLPAGELSSEMLLEAILRHDEGEWAPCPVRPPMCASARLAVGRNGQLTLMAAADADLSNLQSVARALQWLQENRSLIRMAMPQLAIDANAEPTLRLFVNHADLSAQALSPLVESRQVRIQPYRCLRWREMRGLLLDAA